MKLQPLEVCGVFHSTPATRCQFLKQDKRTGNRSYIHTVEKKIFFLTFSFLSVILINFSTYYLKIYFFLR